MSALFNFLQRNQIEQGRALPLVHSTEAYYIKKFMKTGRIAATRCTFFTKEDLSYFFVGRPAYKRLVDTEAEYWELPICFIIDFKAVQVKRIFPFDSGAFKSALYPSYISMMDLNEFEVGQDPHSVQKIVGTFFASNSKYFSLKPREKESFEAKFEVDVLNEEIKALHRLIGERNGKIDDRRFSIEIQSTKDTFLTPENVLAVVLPETYLENDEVLNYVESNLNATLITYPIYPLNKTYYYYAIYEKVQHFFKNRGLFDV